jgi:tetratricopeptide (TPR) repeat protein
MRRPNILPGLAGLVLAPSLWFAGVCLPLGAVDLAVLEAGSAAQLTALGNEALVQARLEAAVDYYTRALAVDRTSFPALFNLALTQQQLGHDQEAKQWYDEALRQRPDHPEVLCNLGFLAFRAKDFTTAADRFLEAARLAGNKTKDAADYWFNAGTARERLSQFVAAARAYDEALVLDSDHYGARFNLGSLYLGRLADQSGALDKAIAHLTKATAAEPGRSEAWVNLALAHERSGSDPGKAFAQALEVAKGPERIAALWQRARWYARCSPPRKPAMRDDLLAILAIDATHAEANGMLGAYYFAIGEYDNAIKHLEAEVSGDRFDPNTPGDLECRYLLALIYTDHRSDPAKALAHATAYYQHRPDAQKIHDLRRRAQRLDARE